MSPTDIYAATGPRGELHVLDMGSPDPSLMAITTMRTGGDGEISLAGISLGRDEVAELVHKLSAWVQEHPPREPIVAGP